MQDVTPGDLYVKDEIQDILYVRLWLSHDHYLLIRKLVDQTTFLRCKQIYYASKRLRQEDLELNMLIPGDLFVDSSDLTPSAMRLILTQSPLCYVLVFRSEISLIDASELSITDKDLGQATMRAEACF